MRMHIYIVQLVLTLLMVFVFPIMLFASDVSVEQTGNQTYFEASENNHNQLSSTQAGIKVKKYTFLYEPQINVAGGGYDK